MSDRSSLAPLDRVCAFLPKLPKSYAARGSCSTSSCPSRLAKRFLRLNHPITLRLSGPIFIAHSFIRKANGVV